MILPAAPSATSRRRPSSPPGKALQQAGVIARRMSMSSAVTNGMIDPILRPRRGGMKRVALTGLLIPVGLCAVAGNRGARAAWRPAG